MGVRTLWIACFAALWALLVPARPVLASNPQQWMTTIPRAEDGRGIKVGDRTLFHPGLAVTTGWDSNVFSANPENVGGDGVRSAFFVTPSLWLGIGNRRIRDGLLDSPPAATAYKADYAIEALAGYRFYLSGDEKVRGAGKLDAGLRGRLMIAPGRRFSFGLEDDFMRIGEPQQLEVARIFNLNRFDNKARARLILRPGGGRLSLEADYLSEVLYFERQDVATGDRVVNGTLAEVRWRLRDRSAFMVRYMFHNTVYACCVEVDSGRNEDSNRHKVWAGFSGQVGKKWDLEVLAGYGQAKYYNDKDGPDFQGPLARVGLIFYPTTRTALRAAFFRDFQDSLQGNYSIDTGGTFNAEHKFRWRMYVRAGATVAQRRTPGIPNPGFIGAVNYVGAPGLVRQDLLVTGQVKIEQEFGRLFAVALGYTARVDATDFAVDWNTNKGVERQFYNFSRHVIMLFGSVRY